ncbi:sulfite exporter TauE/SafE family protein [Kordiimonas lipolytica]|uniref:Probable membrane transporter protein n=1 Tax=Kordiimonas lipolytica TaxID=1662421 RepID=A0ABV8UHF9_9PROT|nr:sulfite exporter TauE/SafE family protein [Kordiimonas lipolytica]
MATPINQTRTDAKRKPRWLARTTAGAAATMVAAYGGMAISVDHSALTALEGLFLYLVGLGAATIANSTGVGGGVVFLPAFEFLGANGHIAIVAGQIVGMSFIIQSFGMSTGSLRWLHRIHDARGTDTGVPPAVFLRMLALVLGCALPAMLATQALHTSPPEAVLWAFKAVSVGLGMLVLVTSWLGRGRAQNRSHPTGVDYAALAGLSLIGGVATAFFSVGVGELVALYLFVRNFPLVTTAALAVIASAVSVLFGVWDHLLSTPQPWDILLYVVPGAITGGFIARPFAEMLGPFRLKIFAASWITLSSAYLLFLA